ncbi:MAG: hypothetical protein J0L86_16165 [Flavobacteriales bacterium]|nr:hypothetical protein [Flavobacteriales bacterium]
MKSNLLFIAMCSLSLVSCNDDDEMMPTPVASEFSIVTASNTSGRISYTDLSQSSPTVEGLTHFSFDADGIFYDPSNDGLILASRTNNKLEFYNGIKSVIATDVTSIVPAFSSTSDFNNPREIAVMGDKVVVTQDQNAANGNTNKLVVYQKTSTGFTLLNSYTVNFKTWGIFLDGTTLYAVADLTGDLVSFNNFFANASGAITPTKRVTIEGLVRTHGIVHSAADNRMVLTDVGSATSDSDGGLIVINNFASVYNSVANGGTLSLSNQVRVYGPNSTMGNPVDVAYDDVTERIYVAERLNAGGRLLTFTLPTSNGDATPIEARAEAGIASVFLVRR